MNATRDPGFDPRIAGWLEDKPATAPAQVVEIVLAAIPSVSQRRAANGFPWRYLRMTSPIRVAAGLVAALAIAFGSFMILNATRDSSVGPSASPSSSPSASPSSSPSASPSSSPSATPNGPLDGTSWITQITPGDASSVSPAIAVGTWTLRFTAGPSGTTISLGNPRGGGPDYPMTYGSNNEVALPADPSCARDEGKPTVSSTPSTYRYAIAGNTLTFTLVTTDSCAARVVNLTAHPWTKAP